MCFDKASRLLILIKNTRRKVHIFKEGVVAITKKIKKLRKKFQKVCVKKEKISAHSSIFVPEEIFTHKY